MSDTENKENVNIEDESNKMQIEANRKVKDSIFCSLFREKENALSLYNAVNRTSYTDPDELDVQVVENSVYMGYNEDNSFIIDSVLAMYEHQSTYNPNMPVRMLIYIADVYKRYIWHQKDNASSATGDCILQWAYRQKGAVRAETVRQLREKEQHRADSKGI